MRLTTTILGFLVIVLFSQCRPSYISANYPEKAPSHKILAIVPFQMTMTGNLPEGMTPEAIASIEEAESKAFQLSLFDQIMRRTGIRKKDIAINLQGINKTNKLLKEAGISIRDSWDETPEDLAKILGVDAIVRTRVSKKKYMSDMASMGIEIAEDILGAILKTPIFMPGGNLNKTDDVRISSSILDGQDGTAIWSYAASREAEWDRPANQIIENLNSAISNKFPYRNTKRGY